MATQAQVYVLSIDVGNPSAVTFTATGSNATANDALHTSASGTELLLFFTSAVTASSAFTTIGTLKVPASDAFTNGGSNHQSGLEVDLDLYRGSPPNLTETFSTASPAFQGVATLDLSAFSAFLPVPGTTGDIEAGYRPDHGPVIGQWIVVPEPSEYAVVVGLSLAGFAFWRRRKA